MRALVAGLIIMLGGIGGASAQVAGRWEARPLLVFAPDEAQAAPQVALLDDPAREDYRLAVYVVTPAAVAPRFGAPAPGADAAALRKRFDVSAGDFRVVLIGLDGGAKLVRGAPVALEELAATIEAMPMRRDELRRRARD